MLLSCFAGVLLLLAYTQSLNPRMRLVIVPLKLLMVCCQASALCLLSRSYSAGEYLVRERLLLLPEVDAHFAAAITANQAGGATELAVHLLKAAAQDPQPPLTGLDLSATSEACLGSLFITLHCSRFSLDLAGHVWRRATAVLNCGTIGPVQPIWTSRRDLWLHTLSRATATRLHRRRAGAGEASTAHIRRCAAAGAA